MRNREVIEAFSKGEQQKRFLERLDNPDENWKLSVNDVKEPDYPAVRTAKPEELTVARVTLFERK